MIASRALRAARALAAVERRDTHWSAADIGGAIWVELWLWVEHRWESGINSPGATFYQYQDQYQYQYQYLQSTQS